MSLRLLNIAKTALLSHRSAIEVVGHNTANVQTPGYVRQRPVMAAVPGAVTGEAGGGVIMTDLQRLRDQFLATQLAYEQGWLGQERALRASLGQVEHLFSDFSDRGLANLLEDMFDSWGDLGLDPMSPAAREQVVQRAELVAQAISGRWQDLRDLRFEIDHRLADLVEEVNSLAAQVGQINAKIGSAAGPSGRNDLMTQRESLLGRLAELCGAEAIEQENGVVDVVIGGRRLVQHDQVIELTLVPDPAQPGMHLVALGSGVSPAGLRGEIAGRLQARDQFIPGYMASLDDLAQALADAVNAQHSAGFDLNGNAAGDFFTYTAASAAATLAVRQEIIDDPTLIGAAENPGAPGDGANAMVIEDLRNNRMLEGGRYTASEFTAQLFQQVGIDAETADIKLGGRQLLVANLQDAYEAQSGVSLDEEAVELIRYQEAYTAASRMVAVALEMMDSVLALK